MRWVWREIPVYGWCERSRFKGEDDHQNEDRHPESMEVELDDEDDEWNYILKG